ncbi:V-set and transmembrane domain-containing protein 2B-like isoform X6 [Lethenteron reissneri]|uniref:V-set and transmembrane domain-containing protein 2B-like isoform X6 n=1 Tax=Lethenteron reissneri TaxID=7753 RepID=UPI002AB73F77|nr:V-set and transmembrane domain-containing protein 2B-like isoform X6 [Lethenteron reissneri]
MGLAPFLIVQLHLFALAQAGMFTEVPQDVMAVEGDDVVLICAYQGSGPTSHSIEMQWWHMRGEPYRGGPAPKALLPATSPARPQTSKNSDATKISAVKVMGSDISNYLRLSSVRREDEGLYECRVSDRSDDNTQEHKAQATLRVDFRLQGDMQHAPEARPLIRGNPALGKRQAHATPPALREAGGHKRQQAKPSSSTSAPSQGQPAGRRQPTGSGGPRWALSGFTLSLLLTLQLLPF